LLLESPCATAPLCSLTRSEVFSTLVGCESRTSLPTVFRTGLMRLEVGLSHTREYCPAVRGTMTAALRIADVWPVDDGDGCRVHLHAGHRQSEAGGRGRELSTVETSYVLCMLATLPWLTQLCEGELEIAQRTLPPHLHLHLHQYPRVWTTDAIVGGRRQRQEAGGRGLWLNAV
jgi:hypothetical protein